MIGKAITGLLLTVEKLVKHTQIARILSVCLLGFIIPPPRHVTFPSITSPTTVKSDSLSAHRLTQTEGSSIKLLNDAAVNDSYLYVYIDIKRTRCLYSAWALPVPALPAH